MRNMFSTTGRLCFPYSRGWAAFLIIPARSTHMHLEVKFGGLVAALLLGIRGGSAVNHTTRQNLVCTYDACMYVYTHLPTLM